MKTYQVTLTKSYVVTVDAETSDDAKRVCEFYTGDIDDISTKYDRIKENFEIENIECTVNETYEYVELENNERN
ncbi:MAG: hypothetical protein A3K10_18035 [Bacteroidetes bacterium RIFCSPLOWO2_12_FULL_31_6]|nr:MAG: hypothetical protein A3K10_18035 [Bacteroidetes bacterium RIFCSPLOWO2_12_FULL_31_6]